MPIVRFSQSAKKINFKHAPLGDFAEKCWYVLFIVSEVITAQGLQRNNIFYVSTSPCYGPSIQPKDAMPVQEQQ